MWSSRWYNSKLLIYHSSHITHSWERLHPLQASQGQTMVQWSLLPWTVQLQWHDVHDVGKWQASAHKHQAGYICLYACMHVCMHVCMFSCMFACMYERMYVPICTYGCMSVYTYQTIASQQATKKWNADIAKWNERNLLISYIINIYIYHISIEVSFLSQKKSPRNATEAILHQPCWWGGPGAIVTGVAADALLHILIRWNGWNPKKLEVGYRRFHTIYLCVYMCCIAESFISMLQKVNNLEFRPLFLDVFTSVFFRWVRCLAETFQWRQGSKQRFDTFSWQTSILVLPVSTFFWKKSEKHTGEPKVRGGVTAPPATL